MTYSRFMIHFLNVFSLKTLTPVWATLVIERCVKRGWAKPDQEKERDQTVAFRSPDGRIKCLKSSPQNLDSLASTDDSISLFIKNLNVYFYFYMKCEIFSYCSRTQTFLEELFLFFNLAGSINVAWSGLCYFLQ